MHTATKLHQYLVSGISAFVPLDRWRPTGAMPAFAQQSTHLFFRWWNNKVTTGRSIFCYLSASGTQICGVKGSCLGGNGIVAKWWTDISHSRSPLVHRATSIRSIWRHLLRIDPSQPPPAPSAD